MLDDYLYHPLYRNIIFSDQNIICYLVLKYYVFHSKDVYVLKIEALITY